MYKGNTLEHTNITNASGSPACFAGPYVCTDTVKVSHFQLATFNFSNGVVKACFASSFNHFEWKLVCFHLPFEINNPACVL